MKNNRIKNIIAVAASLTLLMSGITAFAELQTLFASDESDKCGYIDGDTADTEVTNLIACQQQCFPKGTIVSWNNPDDFDAESIELFRNGEEIEADWNLQKGSFNKIGVDELDKTDVFTLKLKKNGAENTYTARNMFLSTVVGDWNMAVSDEWKSSSEGTSLYGNGAAFIDSTQGYNSNTSLKFISNHFQTLRSGSNKNHNENVSNDARLKAIWSIPADQGTLVNGVTYQLRYMVKTVNADRLHVWCSDGDRWDGAKGNQNISRNSDWVEKIKTFTKTDAITSFVFSVAQKCDEIAIDDIRIGEYDVVSDEFTPLIVETFEPNSGDDEPKNFILTPGSGVRSVSWVNPKADNLKKISLYSVDETGEELIGDDYDTGAGVRQHYAVSSSIICVKIVFEFKDGKCIQLFASVDNKTLYGNTIPEWKFGLNQQGTFKYNPAKFVVDTENNAGEEGTASAKFVSNHTGKIDKTFVTAMHSGFSMEEGKKYRVSYWVKSDKSVEDLKSTVSYSELFDGYSNSSVTGTSGSYDWKKLSFTYTAISTGTKQLGFEIPYTTDGFWIDNIEIYELNEFDEPIGDNLAVNGDVSDFDYPENGPANIEAEGKDREITISWKNNEGYESVWLYEKNGDEWLYRGSVSSRLPAVTFSRLKRDTEYTFKLVPVTAYGVPGEEQIVSGKTLMLDFEVEKPVISNGELLAGSNSITLKAKNNIFVTPVPVTLVAAIYVNGIIDRVVSNTAAIEKTEPNEEQTELKVSFEIGEGDYSVRVFVLDNLDELNSYYDMEIIDFKAE